MGLNIKNIRDLSIAKGLLKSKKSSATDELVPLIRQALKELNVSYNDTCCNDANLGYGGCPECTGNFASFYDTTDQTGLSNTVLTMQLNSSDTWNPGTITVANNLSGKPTRITFTNEGIYDLQFSAQMVKTGGNNATHAHIWLAKDGTNIPYTATQVGFPSNSVYQVPAWNWFVEITAPNQYIEIKWEINSNADNELFVKSQLATGSIPEIPGLIVTVNQVG